MSIVKLPLPTYRNSETGELIALSQQQNDDKLMANLSQREIPDEQAEDRMLARYQNEVRTQYKGLERALNALTTFDTTTVPGQFNVLFALLSEVSEGFRVTPETTLGDLCDAVIAARPQWFSPLKISEEEFWIALKDKGFPQSQYFTSLDQMHFTQANPTRVTKGYTLRELLKWLSKDSLPPRPKLPKSAPQSTFLEARAVSHALSDAPSAANYHEVEGENALLHAPQRAQLQTRFQPVPDLLRWWGDANPTKEALFAALKKLNFETNVTFQVTLACLLQTKHARRTFTLDEIIKLIGRDPDARRSVEMRQKLRREVWENCLALTSMPVIGARNGTWREPAINGKKRALMAKEKLISREPLLVITGVKGTADTQEPPKEVSMTAGEWLLPFIGNREFLSDFGDVLKIAQIPRGKVSGAWAACIGLALQQKWREQATKAEKKSVSSGKETKVEILKFRPFTRRELLTEMFKCDDKHSPEAILSDPKGRRPRAEEYWESAIRDLKNLGLIDRYREMKALEKVNINDLNIAWLDQPLDIRPASVHLTDALDIHNQALKAKSRTRRTAKKAFQKPSKSR